MTEQQANSSMSPALYDAYHVLFHAVSEGALLLQDNRIIDANARALSMFGGKPAELNHKTLPDLSPAVQPDGSSSISAWQERTAAASSGMPQCFEWVCRRINGETFSVELKLQRLSHPDSHDVLLQVLLNEAGDPVQTEIQVDSSGKLLENTYAASLLVDPDTGQIVDANTAAYTFYGYSRQELLHKKISEINTLTSEQTAQEMARAKSEGRGLFYFRHRLASGEIRDVEVYSGPVEVRGQLLLHSIIHDVTERKRTEEMLAKRANELQAVARLSAAASSILEIDKLLQEVVDLTKSYFDLYHAHIYILDETAENLVLAAGSGKAGRKMAAEGWSIPLAREDSLVARAARSRQGVVVNDVRLEPDFLPNPALPETRSEMAVPLLVGEALLGVLDVQADTVGRFTEEDLRINTTLAAQIAVALQNARLFAEQERMSQVLNDRVKELNCLNEIGRAIAEAPEVEELLEWVTERIPPAMQYPEECVAAIEYEGQAYGAARALTLPCQMTHALRISGEVVGRVYIAYQQKRQFLNEESALLGGIASRVSGYLETRRLLEQVHQALAEVEQSRQFLDTILDNIPAPIFIISVANVYLGCNKAFLELIGKTRDEIIGKSLYEIYDKEQADRYYEADQELYRNPGIQQFETTIQHVDGSLRTILYNRATFTGPDGTLAGQIATILDITERKRVEEALRRNEAQLSEALELARLAYWEFDIAKEMFTFNDQFYALYHTTAEEQGGYSMSVADFVQRFIHPDSLAGVSAQMMQALETTDPNFTTQLESLNLRADGEQVYIVVQVRVIQDEHGRTIKLYGTNQDVTERKLAEMERERLLAEVEAAYRQYVRQEWEQFLGEQQQNSWHIEYQALSTGQQQNGGSGGQVSVPISLRGQPIGAIRLQDNHADRHWTDDDKALVQTVSEQLALTLENLRLFADTQQKATREQLTRQITDKMRSAPDVDSIVETGLQELAKALGVDRVYVRLKPKPSEQSGQAEADVPDIDAIRSQLKHNGHKPPADLSLPPDSRTNSKNPDQE